MSTLRTPPNKYGSSPDLMASDNDIYVSTRKRKQPEYDLDYKLFTMLEEKIDKHLCELNEKILTSINAAVSSALTEQLSTINSNLSNINSTLAKLTNENAIINNSLNETTKRLEVVENAISSSSVKQDLFEAKLQAIEANSPPTAELITQVNNLKSKVAIMDQQARMNNLEISGVPEKAKEDLSTILCNIANYLGIQLSTTDINRINRTRPFNAVPGRPKNIVVNLKSRLLRDSILSAVRAQRGLKLMDIGFPSDKRRIYINEHLTPGNKLLYKNIKAKAQATQYQFVWIRDCKIFVRKNDTSPSILIKDMSDIQKMI